MTLVSCRAEILLLIPLNLGYVWALNTYCKEYLNIIKMHQILFVFFQFSGLMLMNVAGEYYNIPYIVAALINHIFLMGLILLLFQGDIEKKVLVTSMLITTHVLVRDFCESLLSCVGLLLLHTVKKIPVPFLSDWESWLITYIRFAIEIMVIYWMSKHLDNIFQGKIRKWYIVIAVPLLAITIVVDVADWGACYGILVKSGQDMGLYYDQIFSHVGFCVLTALSMFAVGFYVLGMNRIYLEQTKSSRYHAQIAAYKMLEEQYSQSERLRHDMKNHFIALQELLVNREWEKMDTYLKTMVEKGNLGTGDDITGNKVVDAILYQKHKEAERQNILWECDVQISKDCCVSEFDLCVLFGNILDNAVEACEKMSNIEDRYINIQAKTVKKYFLLEVKNSAQITDKNEEGRTSKARPKEHGIGLLNVRDIVNKYSGTMNIEVQENTFIISILLPLIEAVHNNKQAI